MDYLKQLALIEEVRQLKKSNRSNHTRTVQVKLPTDLRDALYTKLKVDQITFKDLILKTIEIYLRKDLK